jgi:uncharacterized protein (UPF0332 family)
MSFDWAEYLDIAKVVAKSGIFLSEEAAFRCAISRAYYAAFCSSRNLSLKRGAILKKTGEDHRLVPEYFRKSSDKRHKKIASKLKRLKDNRLEADYEDAISNYKYLWQLSLNDADYIIRILPTL